MKSRIIVVVIAVLLAVLGVLVVCDSLTMGTAQDEELHFIYVPLANGGFTAVPVFY